MRAVIADRPGTPEVLRPVSLPDPRPAAGEVRIGIEYAAITFVDTLIRAANPVAPPAEFPVVLGNGVGGIIDRTGPGVDRSLIGTQVVSTTGGTGGYAELAIASVTDLHRLREGVDLPSAVALLADGRTAVGLHDAAHVQSGDTVVVTAAAGGVGSLLVQLATTAGADVIALAGSESKLDHARSLGAQRTVDYRDEGWMHRVRDVAPGGVDVVFDGVGGDTTTALFGLVRPDGRYLQHGAASGSWTELDDDAVSARRVTLIGLSAIGAAGVFDLTERALDLAAAGLIRPTIGQTFRLTDAAHAHAAIEARSTIGKTLLLP